MLTGFCGSLHAGSSATLHYLWSGKFKCPAATVEYPHGGCKSTAVLVFGRMKRQWSSRNKNDAGGEIVKR